MENKKLGPSEWQDIATAPRPHTDAGAEALGAALVEAFDAAADPADFWAVTELAVRLLRAWGFDIVPAPLTGGRENG